MWIFKYYKYGSNKNNYQNIFNEFKKINQRGPDNTKKIEIKNYTAMFHRLSIIDLKTRSNQPMFSSCKRYLLTFNGEIYNYIELRTYLIDKGVKFITKSDSEVILNGFKKEGAKFVKKITRNVCISQFGIIQKKLIHI